ncbi:MAG: hypothetical protein ACRYF2_18205 [Janthinobacterium lividum]
MVVGYSQLVAPTLVAVADYLREKQGPRERDANIVEVGLRHQVSDALMLGVGLGAGIGRESPQFRGIFSLQIDFGGR